MVFINWMKKEKFIVILAVIGLVFLFVYSWLYSGSLTKFTSPDETVNYYFAKLFADNNGLKVYEPTNQETSDLIAPRNTAVIGENIIPNSFLGIILIYGFLGKIFGSNLIIYLTPLFAVVGIIFFYLLIKEIFHKRIAFISALMAFIIPPYWFYASRGMFHNLLFLDLLIIGLFFLLIGFKENTSKKQLGFISISAIFIGLALITRTAEIVWVILVLIILSLCYRRKVKWWYMLIYLLIMLLCFIPIFYINNNFFGSPFSFGYSRAPINSDSLSRFSTSLIDKIGQLFLPFGFSSNKILHSVNEYLILIFPWISILLIIGLTTIFKRIIAYWIAGIKSKLEKNIINQKIIIYTTLFLIVSCWLIIFYGSYELNEYYDKSKLILGSSYIRYWLPVYIFGLPFLVIAIIKVSQLFKYRFLNKITTVLLLCFFIVMSVSTVLSDSLQGLIEIRKSIEGNRKKLLVIEKVTESNSIIISGYADKIFFPERRVIVNLPNNKDEMIDSLNKLLLNSPVYLFYSPLDNATKSKVNTIRLNGIKLEKVHDFDGVGEILYRLQ